MSWRWPSENTFGMWTVLYWTRSSRTQFDVSINVWRQAGETLNITYLLSPWSRVLLEKLTGSAASPEIAPIFGTRRFLAVLTSARHLSLWTLLVTFSVVIIRCTETSWSPCITHSTHWSTMAQTPPRQHRDIPSEMKMTKTGIGVCRQWKLEYCLEL